MAALKTGGGFKKRRGFGDYFRLAVHQRKAPDAVALGLCIGLFVGLAPLYGLQITLALLLALLLRGSKIAAVLGVFVTNPLTAIPVYSFTYWLGSLALGDPHREKSVRTLLHYCIRNFRWESLEEFRTVIGEVLRLGRGIFPALFVGGLIVAFFASLICYPLTRAAVLRLRADRSDRLQQRARKKEQKAKYG